MVNSPDPRKNHLLAALADSEAARWLPQLEPIEMPLGEVLYESGTTLTHVYFPTTAIVSLLYVMEDGASAEIAVVGNEGVVGIFAVYGRRVDAQPRRRTKRRPRIPFESTVDEE